MKQEGTPDYSARGVAIGLFIGFFMPMGGQLITAIPLAYFLRGNKMLAAVFTFVSNPYTITFIYPFQCWLGSVIIGAPIEYAAIMASFHKVFTSASTATILALGKELGQELILPFFLAGLILGAISAAIGYAITLWLITRHRRKRIAAKANNRMGQGNAATE